MTDRNCCCMDMEMDVGETYDPAFITRHNTTTGRDASDCHPISAITDLPEALAAKMDDTQVDTEVISDTADKVPSSALVKAGLAAKANSADLASVATSGAYSDLSGTPNLATVATSGAYNDLTGKPAIPSKTSDIINDSGFIDNAVNDLVYYYTKNQVFTKAEVEALLSVRLKIAVVATLPATGDADTIYLVPAAITHAGNLRDEYIYVNNAWELIGSTEFTLVISQDATGITINGTALQEASASQPGLMTAAQVTALAGKADAGASYTKAEDDLLLAAKADVGDAYTKAEADTLLAGKVGGSGNIGSDLKPIIIVNGVAVAVANPLVDTATMQDILAVKYFADARFKNANITKGTTPPTGNGTYLRLVDRNGSVTADLQQWFSSSGKSNLVITNRDSRNGLNPEPSIQVAVENDGTASICTFSQRAYSPANTADVVTIGTLQASTDVLHTAGNETASGNKKLDGVTDLSSRYHVLYTATGDTTKYYKVFEHPSSLNYLIQFEIFGSNYSTSLIQRIIGHYWATGSACILDCKGNATAITGSQFKTTVKNGIVTVFFKPTAGMKYGVRIIGGWNYYADVAVPLSLFTFGDGTTYNEPTTQDYESVVDGSVI